MEREAHFKLRALSVALVALYLSIACAEVSLATDMEQSHESSDAVTSAPGRELFDQGIEFMRKNDCNQAILAFSNALNAGYKTSDVFLNRGRCYFRIGHNHNALKDASEALTYHRRNSEALMLRGAIYDRLGRPKDAINEATQAIEFSPTVGWYYRIRGAGFLSLREYEKALQDFDLARLEDLAQSRLLR